MRTRTMRTHGTLSRWNEDRGFGFIAPADGGDEVFVHISAFPRDGTRPRVHELVSFEIESDGEGKRRAVRVQRPGTSAAQRRSRRREPSVTRRSPVAAVLTFLALGAMGVYGYSALRSGNAVAVAPVEYSGPVAPTAPSANFKCDGRTHCSQMRSCAEARYFLQHCPNVQMDGNNDGEPCEQQWCN
jgi:cold shock CspA family protein